MARFDDALKLTLRFEGGYSDHPSDPGGATMKGVTQRVYHRWLSDQGQPRRPVREIKHHEVKAIYRWRYWVPSKAMLLPEPVDALQFDCAVNCGVGRAIRLLQASAGSEPDGVWGPNTEAAVDAAPPDWLADAMLWAREAYYRRISDGDLIAFLRGWLWRLEELEKAINLPRAPAWDRVA